MGLLVTKIIVDILLAGMLFATIIYAIRLNKRIKVLQDSRSELSQLVKYFDDTTERAVHCVAEVHKVSRRINENMQHHIDKATFIADDLSQVISRGTHMQGGGSGEPDGVEPRRGVRTALEIASAEATKSRVSRQASDEATLRRRAVDQKTDSDHGENEPSIEESEARIEEMLKQIQQDQESVVSPELKDMSDRERPGNVKLRSKAEQELFESLRGSTKA